MANIINSWSFVNFVEGKRLKYANLTNKNTSEDFHAIAVCDTAGEVQQFIGFSQKLGELSPAELKAQASTLQVVECTTEKGDRVLRLCKQGTGEGAWQEFTL